MRRLLPARLYPGHERVGRDLARLEYGSSAVFDGLDWYWVPSMPRALAFLARRRPDIVVFQWWTGSVLHSYLVLAAAARLLGCRIIVEFHEFQDTGEERIRFARWYVGIIGPPFMRLATAFTVHSNEDTALLKERISIGRRPVYTLPPHGPYDHYQVVKRSAAASQVSETVCRLLFFGVIRPYKGLEDLIQAFDAIPEDEIDGFWLTIVGETWEGWDLPERLIAASSHRDRISFVNRYVHDDEVDSFFSRSDVVVLPYRRSAMSGPLQIAMAYGLPVIATDVSGLVTMTQDYPGAVLVAPGDVQRLSTAIREAPKTKGARFSHPTSWDATARVYERIANTLRNGSATPEAVS
jgi:glycosyltransferase involved in cell wall biosynthesis